MDALERIAQIDRSALDGAFYTNAVLEAGAAAGLLTPADLGRIHFAALALLARKTERYTGGESSSVRLETVQSLLGSILFTVGVYLKTLPLADDAALALQTQPLEALYALGRTRITTRVRTARGRYRHLLDHPMPLKNEFYRATVQGGIPCFFRRYDPTFAAQEIHMTPDYPLANALPPLAGVEFILAYLDALALENSFLRCFDPVAMHQVLLGYSRSYARLSLNLCEQVLACAVGCVLAGEDVALLSVPGAAALRLQAALLCKTRAELGALVAAAAGQLSTQLHLPNGVRHYVERTLPGLTARVALGVEQLTLARVFPQAL